MIDSIKVKLWNELVGILVWDPKQRNTYFYFNPEFNRPGYRPFPLFLHDRILSGEIPAYGDTVHPQNQKLPFFLAGSLPDDWGNELFEQWRVMNRLSPSQVTPLSKLSFIGTRGMGALEFEPNVKVDLANEPLDVKTLVEQAKKICDERHSYVLTQEEELTMKNLIAVGTSAGGRQAKALIAIDRESGDIRSGQISGYKDSDYYLLKFGSSIRNSGEIEMAYHELVRQAQIEMCDSKLLQIENERHFMTRRFDRANGEKIHMLTLAAINPEADSYEKLIQTCRMLELPLSTLNEVYRRMVFNVLANNTDDHPRNFSFIMDKSGKWKLSPAYDMTYIFNERGGYLPKDERCLMVNGKRSDIDLNDLLTVATGNDIQNPKRIIAEVGAALGNFERVAKKYGVGDEWRGRISSCIRRNLLKFGIISAVNNERSYVDDTGVLVDNIHIEAATNGTYHLTATLDGISKKFIIGRNKPGYAYIRDNGECIELMPSVIVKSLVNIYLLKNKDLHDEMSQTDIHECGQPLQAMMDGSQGKPEDDSPSQSKGRSFF